MPKIQSKVNLDKAWEIHIPPILTPAVDERTRAKSIAFPIKFPDGYNGHLIVVKGVRMGWEPSEDISTIVINFK